MERGPVTRSWLPSEVLRLTEPGSAPVASIRSSGVSLNLDGDQSIIRFIRKAGVECPARQVEGGKRRQGPNSKEDSSHQYRKKEPDASIAYQKVAPC
jgi:hypothetical protein